MASEMVIDLTQEGVESVAELESGQPTECKVYGTVRSNDGKTVIIDIESVEHESGDYEEEDTTEEEMPKKHMGPMGGKPIAVIAIGTKK